jgi:DNA-binding response OmpR family regulator
MLLLNDLPPDPVAVVIESGTKIQGHVEDYLRRNEVRLIACNEERDVEQIILETRPSVVLLNLNLRGNLAFELCQKIKEKTQAQVVMISDSYTEIEKIVSLEMGADDCLPLDFDPRQLIARIRRVLNAQWAHHKVVRKFGCSEVVFSRYTREVQVGRRAAVSLTPAEYELLGFLVKNTGRILTREEIHGGIFGPSSRYTFQFVDVLVYRVRKKIETDYRKPKLLRTIRNLGYVLALDTY